MARYLSSSADMTLFRAVVTLEYGATAEKEPWTSVVVYGPYSRASTAKQVGMSHVGDAKRAAEVHATLRFADRYRPLLAASCVVEQASTVWTRVQ